MVLFFLFCFASAYRILSFRGPLFTIDLYIAKSRNAVFSVYVSYYCDGHNCHLLHMKSRNVCFTHCEIFKSRTSKTFEP